MWHFSKLYCIVKDKHLSLYKHHSPYRHQGQLLLAYTSIVLAWDHKNYTFLMWRHTKFPGLFIIRKRVYLLVLFLLDSISTQNVCSMSSVHECSTSSVCWFTPMVCCTLCYSYAGNSVLLTELLLITSDRECVLTLSTSTYTSISCSDNQQKSSRNLVP